MAPRGYPFARPARLRAPQNSGEVLVAPSFDRAADLVAANGTAREAWDEDVLGTGLGELAQAARRQIVDAARAYTRTYAPDWAENIASSDPFDPEAPIFLAGHQPELFHPGVWLKNFALGRLAQRCGGVGINLIIDADDVRDVDVRVPTGTPALPRVESVPFDLPLPPQPYEERPIRDRSTFASFGERAAECLAPLVDRPLLAEFWPSVCERSAEANLGPSVAQARHLLELAWGNRTLELPQSWMCRLPAFRALFCHMLAHLPRMHEVYNAALNEFRSRHGIKNHAQPMPNLESSGSWLEAPLWIWSVGQPTRRRLFARGVAEGVELSDFKGWSTVLPLSAEGDCRAAVDRLDELELAGVKLRSRALVTTLIARLLGCDLFIHGIGGARYDEVTDELMRDFFACVPPSFLVVSGTLCLPIELETPLRRGSFDWKQRLRDLTYHPEVYLDEVALSAENQAEADSLVSEKQRSIRIPKSPETVRTRHLAIESANRQLQTFVLPLIEEADAAMQDMRNAVRVRQTLQSREYAFCLYPAEALQRLLFAL